ncbi:methionine ABC transporter ATP-binding protein [Zeimonas arvi]|uniref:Cell division ATP-binding protein FtsE n=1 Tax=Zeimonas arvi TaxID=2498847 RepID=A0A5C8NTR2_9BURK|nr:methionine ABC transporter ATP-binding protein [Zeimonas arvi]TXL64144.1 methionine ABC transporter ATP-binding protein [Zeimonas arvi]
MAHPSSQALRSPLRGVLSLLQPVPASGAVPVARGDGPAVAALEDIDLSVARGEIVGVIGRSGAGKSTLIRLVNGLESPTSGRVVVDGIDVGTLDERALGPVRRSIGMIFQHFNLLSSRTVFDNVALPLEIAGVDRAGIRRRVEPLLEMVGLADKRDRYPAELSGGQKQRVGIARALATQPKVLLSDEATSALDPETTTAILDLLAGIQRELGLTILLITHEMAVIRRIAHRVAVIDGGRIVEQGEVADVFAAPAHATTRSFLGAETGRGVPAWIAERLQTEPVEGGKTVLRIVFRGEHATDPVLSQLSRELGIDVNILSGSIERIGGSPFGILLVALPGDAAAQARAARFLADRELHTEVIGHVR